MPLKINKFNCMKINKDKIKSIFKPEGFKILVLSLFTKPPLSILLNISKRLVLPGFDGLPLYDVAKFFFKGILKGSITSRAASLSFKFYLALFPAILFFFTIIPYVPVPGFQESLLNLMSNVLPPTTYDVVHETVFDIITRQRGGLLSIGFLMALYFATNGVNGIIEAFNETYHSRETRGAVKQRLIAVVLVFIICFVLIIATSLIIGSTALFNYLESVHIIMDSFAYYLIMLGKWVIVVAMFFFCISFLYYLGPAKKKRYRFISAGATLATILSIAASLGFNYYILNFSKYNTLYGSIGTLIIILLWINFNATILLVGFELNASIIEARKNKSEQYLLNNSNEFLAKNEK